MAPARLNLTLVTKHAPAIPSLLRIPCTPPLSPLLPTNAGSRPHFHASLPTRKPSICQPPPPPKPLPWLWQCHLCYRAYPLAVTSHCIEDGHRFCSGQQNATTSPTTRHGGMKKTLRKSKKSRKANNACKSEFDYAGWKAWGDWRRSTLRTHRRSSPKAHDCSEECDYPSECRWGQKKPREKKRGRDREEETQVQSGSTGPATSFEEILAGRGKNNEDHVMLDENAIPQSLVAGVSTSDWRPERTSSLAPTQSQNPLFYARSYDDDDDYKNFLNSFYPTSEPHSLGAMIDPLTGEDLDGTLACTSPGDVMPTHSRRKSSGATLNMHKALQKTRYFAKNLALL